MRSDTIQYSIKKIRIELKERLKYFRENNKLLEAQRLEDRVNHDLESLDEFGICPGIENYARYMDRRAKDVKPYTLLDYFPKNSLFFIDESHMMIPQLNAMYNGDRARKTNLVNYGFRLPSALDNRPLKFEEFIKYKNQKVYVSATPSEYEIDISHGLVTEQIVRPTGLLEPTIEIRPIDNQIENIMDEIKKQNKKDERTIILTTTIRMSEELTKFLQEKRFKVGYIHSELKTLQRTEILRKLRKGIIDVLVGINLLKEGIDLPEVSLVIVLDADKESFFRSTRALIQIVGRASRNKNGHVIFYANRMTKAMNETISITDQRRKVQIKYNKKHNITPTTIVKAIPEPISSDGNLGAIDLLLNQKRIKKSDTESLIKDFTKQMLRASKEMNYERAAQLRDIIIELKTK
jgi:excinuclease ABC subunit B